MSGVPKKVFECRFVVKDYVENEILEFIFSDCKSLCRRRHRFLDPVDNEHRTEFVFVCYAEVLSLVLAHVSVANMNYGLERFSLHQGYEDEYGGFHFPI